MNDCVIKVEHLSKQYFIGTAGHSPYRTLRDSISSAFQNSLNMAKNKFTRTSPFTPPNPSVFNALDDLSFSVNDGDIVGIIGRNGAGKSTLLKILSRITAPTKGTVSVTGRVASLLEVGTGFHPELSGRENIFMNGAILGMSRREIKSKFDEIVAFSEVEKFIDTPVKRYSSGMYVRLAFAVAAHLDPDILIVDEVLSVGDAAFQRKCIGAMKNVAKRNRTVLFVTHNLPLVRALCTRAILIDKGQLALDGLVDPVLNAFTKKLQISQDFSQENFNARLNRQFSGKARFTKVLMKDSVNQERWSFESGEEIKLSLSYKVIEPLDGLSVYLAIRSALSGEILTTVCGIISKTPPVLGTGLTFDILFPSISLRPGDYSLYVCLGDLKFERFHDVVDETVNLPLLTISSSEPEMHKRYGYFSIPSQILYK